MTTRKVVWTAVAARDVERIAERLAEDAPLRVEKIIDRIIDHGEALGALSNRGRTPPELRAIGDRTWLEVIESPWRIVYRIVGETVEIHAVLDGRRDLRDLLLERLLT